MSTSSEIGLGAMIFAVIGVLTPGFGIYFGWIALAIAAVAALYGDRTFTIATCVLGVASFGPAVPDLSSPVGMDLRVFAHPHVALSCFSLTLPMAAIALNRKGRLTLGTDATDYDET